MTQVVWQEDGDHALTAESEGMHLAVARTGSGRTVRFLIRRRACLLSDFFVVQSGYRDSLEQAMQAAENVAAQLSSSYRA